MSSVIILAPTLRIIESGAGARQGRATLSSGSVTVSTTSIGTNSEVFLSVQTVGGVPGTLTKSNVVAGTSFDIVSTSGSDSSVVAWLISDPL